MFQPKFESINLDANSKMRMVEIEFYLIFKPIYASTVNGNAALGLTYMETLSKLMGRDPLALTTAYNIINKKYVKPSKRELAVFGRYKGLSYDDIVEHIGIAKNTIRRHVKDYIDDEQPTLPSRLSPAITEDLVDILKDIKIYFAPMGNMARILRKAERKSKK
ncbi:MAG TPA: hypothetical protein VK190_02185 [Pseudoneobacillus sp.]|jgi:hypothetical protein|nr:hypothetical protein [Pseudoneobacillus sp.]